jgi:galactose mutarotase-like enzyme
VSAEVVERRFQDTPALELRSGALRATFVPGVGMTGVSLRLHGREHLALPGGVDALRAGHTAGLPLLAPWANRLASRRYRAAGVDVDLRRLRLHTDEHGLPIHGLLVGWPEWEVTGTSARRDVARLTATTIVDARAFPFPHLLEVVVEVHDDRLVIDTTLVATGDRKVPVAFGWHPYLRVPGTPRSRWTLRLPARDHLALDDRGIPTGATTREPAEEQPIGRRTFDDLYHLGRDRRLAFIGEDGAAVAVTPNPHYPYAQVWVPAGKPFAALEPMAARTNGLVDGDTHLVEPGDAFTARFSLEVASPEGPMTPLSDATS